MWAIRQLAQHRARWQLLCDAFGAQRSQAVRNVLQHALARDYRVHFLEMDTTRGRVTSRDISGLDPSSPDSAEADWGGLTGFSSRFGEAVRSAVNEEEQD